MPQGQLVAAVAKHGTQGTAADLGVSTDQLENLITAGAGSSEGSLEEFRMLAVQAALSELEMRRDDLPTTAWVKEVSALQFVLEDSLSNELVRHETASLGDLPVLEHIPKFNSGFVPLDQSTGGLYQGILLLIAKPGHGKTSMMLSIMEALRKKNAASSLWFYETEIPMKLMRWRMKPITERTEFKKEDLLVCGNLSIPDIVRQVDEAPDPERVIFIDSPDALAGGSADTRRFVLESIFRDLVRLKSVCKMVVVSSQPRRNDSKITLESGAEAWAKAWYSDIIVGVSRVNELQGGGHRVRLSVVKNRFGIPDQEVSFRYNYGDLSWEAVGKTSTGDGWEDDEEPTGTSTGEDW